MLAISAEEWTAEYLGFLNRGETPPVTVRFRYRHPEIKSALRSDAFDKCIYCESKVSHVYPGDTDHILPVSQRPDLIVSWTNLAYTCRECNHAKRDYYDRTEPLVNPYEEEPDDFVRFFGPIIVQAPGSARGILTIGRLRLHRPSLIERRSERIQRLQPLIDTWKTMSDGPTKDLIRETIHAEGGPDREYSAAVQAFLQATRWD